MATIWGFRGAGLLPGRGQMQGSRPPPRLSQAKRGLDLAVPPPPTLGRRVGTHTPRAMEALGSEAEELGGPCEESKGPGSC